VRCIGLLNLAGLFSGSKQPIFLSVYFGLGRTVAHLTKGDGSKLKNRERKAQGEQDDAD
jgi:hypothetical protein